MSLYLNPTYYFRNVRIVPSVPILPICSSLDNYFVPIFAGIGGKVHEYKGRKMLVYNLKETLVSQPTNLVSLTLTRFVNSFHTGSDCIKYNTGIGGVEYYAMKHFVYTYVDDKIIALYCLCSTKELIFKINPRIELDFANTFLLINNELFSNPAHSIIGSKLKSLLNYFKLKGTNIIYTNNINKLCLNETSEIQSFNSIDERMEFINNIKKELGFNYARPEPEPEPPPFPPVPDPRVTEDFLNLII